MTTFSPGDVAMVQCSDGEWRQAVALLRPNGLLWSFADDTYRRADASTARPLVVIDAENVKQVERLCQNLGHSTLNWYGSVGEMQYALRGLLPRPKPPEPACLGSVVEDADYHLHTLARVANAQPWVGSNGRWRTWDQIAAVRVLSEGVTA
ncbi:MAG: hypothetical protein JWO15_3865 [Sphingomonadales bacterium]|nr:hypothetical protein [Sphingomonadales bacterium]